MERPGDEEGRRRYAPMSTVLVVLAVAGWLGTSGLPPSGGAAAMAAAVGPELTRASPGAQEASTITFEGEHGLAVFLEDDRVEVRWLTDASSRGLFEAKVDGRTLHGDTTPEALHHRTRFVRPAGSDVVLRYGALADASGGGGGLHETTITLEDPSKSVRATVRDVDSLFVVGDVHGEFGRLRSLLRNAGLVDGDGSWTGGGSHLVFLGDLFDRGPDVLPLLWFVYRLEREARAAGGRIHVVLGNHEIMVLTGDLRYVSAKESIVATRHGLEYSGLFDVKRSLLGRWLASKPAALVVDDVLLAHGGVGPAYADQGARSINDSLHAFVSEELFRAWADTTVEPAPIDSAALERRTRFFFEDPSVFWYRGYAMTDTLDAHLSRTLDRNDARLHVVAHTAVPTIRETYDGRLILVDLQRPASELLLLTRSDGRWKRYVYGLEGSARPLRR
jgi:hypothetical protein